MKRIQNFNVDLTTGAPLPKILIYSLPLMAVTVLTILVTPLQQSIYAGHIGPAAFAIPALLAQFLSLLASVTNDGFGLNANISALSAISRKDDRQDQYVTMTFYSQAAVALVLSLTAGLLYRPIFRLMSVPDNYFAEARLYYFCALLSYFLTSVNNYLVTLYFGCGSIIKNLIFRAITPIGSLASAYLFLSVLHMGVAGVALSGVPVLVVSSVIFARCIIKQQNIRHLSPDFFFMRQKFGRYFLVGLVYALRNMIVAGSYLVASVMVNRVSDQNLIAALGLDIALTTIITVLGAGFRVFCVQNYSMGNKAHLKKGLRQAILGFTGIAILLMCIYIFGGRAYLTAVGIEEPVLSRAVYCFRIKSIGLIPLTLLCTVRFFFESIGYTKTAFAAGCMEAVYCLSAGLIFIPQFGDFFAASYIYLGWLLSAAFCVVMYLVRRRKIWTGT